MVRYLKYNGCIMPGGNYNLLITKSKGLINIHKINTIYKLKNNKHNNNLIMATNTYEDKEIVIAEMYVNSSIYYYILEEKNIDIILELINH